MDDLVVPNTAASADTDPTGRSPVETTENLESDNLQDHPAQNTGKSKEDSMRKDADRSMEDTADADPTNRNSQAKQDPANTSPVVRFYEGGNMHGRTLEEIIGWSDTKLEYTHDFIQILFPIPERSNFMSHPAAILDEQTMEDFRNKPDLQACMRKALARMLQFFGFDYQIVDQEVTDERLCHIVPNPERFPRAARNWMNSHNDLRITRIIRCLRCCGMDVEAREFYKALRALHASRVGYPRRISDRTFTYWTRAAKRDLRIPPDMSDAEAERLGNAE